MDKEQDKIIVKILEERCGLPTAVHLSNNRVLLVNNIAWGYDEGDDFAHITTNISPSQDNIEIDFFYSNEIKKIIDKKSGQVIYEI